MKESANTVPQIYNKYGWVREEEILKFILYVLTDKQLVFTQILPFFEDFKIAL